MCRSTFSAEQLISDCRLALRDPLPGRSVKEVVQRAIAAPAQVLSALGTPGRAGLFPVYQSSTLTILNVVWAPGMSIYPHDHRMWAVIGVYGGTEDNVFSSARREALCVPPPNGWRPETPRCSEKSACTR
jgi:predicted metal-dependent enzyme (double-stranded beta helix superfamily)